MQEKRLTRPGYNFNLGDDGTYTGTTGTSNCGARLTTAVDATPMNKARIVSSSIARLGWVEDISSEFDCVDKVDCWRVEVEGRCSEVLKRTCRRN